MNQFLSTFRATCILIFILLVSRTAHAVTYYVDNVGGNDSNTGTSSTAAWKTVSKVNSITSFYAGDIIRFKCGGAWTQRLRPKGSGTSSAPITIDSYGTGAKPIINGGGASDEGPDGIINTPDDILHGGATILLVDQSYWNIYNIEVTNISTVVGNRQGIKIVATDVPGSTTDVTVQGITIKNVTVRDVFGQYDFENGKDTGGISLFFYRASQNAAKVDAKFNNIRIEECTIRNINRGGIFSGGSDNLKAEDHFDSSNYPISGLVIRRNIVESCTGDGIVVRFAKSPIIESNRAYDNHNGDESLVKHGVALWCRSTTDAVFQFNEVYGTKGTTADGLAFDADLGAVNTVFQYNYSHDNLGGFVLFMRSGTNDNTTVRYNISQNDGKSNSLNRIFHFSLWPQGNDHNGVPYKPGVAQIYNNTIYIHDTNFSDDASKVAISNNADANTTYVNNLIYTAGGAIVRRSTDAAKWQYNHFQGFSAIPGSATGIYGEGVGVNTNTQGNAYLNNPGTAGDLTGIGTKNSDWTSSLGTQLDGYKITSTASPAYQKGKLVSANGGRDFYGLTVSATARPNKGAHNGLLSTGLMAVQSLESFSPAIKLKSSGKVLYPNPVIDKLSISNLPSGTFNIEIVNTLGKVVLKSHMINGELNVGNLVPGNYVLFFPGNRDIKSFSFIKTN